MEQNGCQKYGSDGYVCDIFGQPGTAGVREHAEGVQEELYILSILTIPWMVNQRREGRIE